MKQNTLPPWRSVEQQERYARELHDVAFTFGTLPPFDQLKPQTRQWFMDRASRLIGMIDGGEL